jgi:hypothetical protein
LLLDEAEVSGDDESDDDYDEENGERNEYDLKDSFVDNQEHSVNGIDSEFMKI